MSPQTPKCSALGCPEHALLGKLLCRAHHATATFGTERIELGGGWAIPAMPENLPLPDTDAKRRHAAISAAVHAWQGKYGEELEKVCEQMLTDPRGWGVMVFEHPIEFTEDTAGSVYRAEIRWEMGLHPDVPFGEIRIQQLHLPPYPPGVGWPRQS